MKANSKLDMLVKLSSKVVVYIPSTKNINESIDNTEYVNKVAGLMSECFGGATASNTIGYWVSDTEGLVKERSTMVFSYCKEADLDKYIDIIIELCRDIKEELKQDAVAFEVNGEMYFV